MSESECPYDAEDLLIFRKFRGVCESITACRFIRSLPNQKHSITVKKLPNGETKTEYPQYDEDDFLAFLTHFRKLVAEKEPTFLFRVINRICKHATDSERTALGGLVEQSSFSRRFLRLRTDRTLRELLRSASYGCIIAFSAASLAGHCGHCCCSEHIFGRI